MKKRKTVFLVLLVIVFLEIGVLVSSLSSVSAPRYFTHGLSGRLHNMKAAMTERLTSHHFVDTAMPFVVRLFSVK